MTELLAVPGWKTPETPLSAWVEAFEAQGFAATQTRESVGVSWVEVPALRLRGYAVTEGLAVEAINFEFDDSDPDAPLSALRHAASALSWELHEDDGEDD